MSSATVTLPEIAAASFFALAVLHTFATKYLSHLAHSQPRHAGLWHLLAEVEVVFGFWALILVATLFWMQGGSATVSYLEARNFTEPLFVFVVMVVAASRPVLYAVIAGVRWLSRQLPLPPALAVYFLCMSFVPLLGSVVTEPAAMTLAALMLRERYFRHGLSRRLRYATLGVLFVNVSIGGTLTSFAAPPVLMVASTWQWDSAFMLATFGWKAALAVLFNAAALTFAFRRELLERGQAENTDATPQVPTIVVAFHLACLGGVVGFAHHPVLFFGIFLLFLGYAEAYPRHQDKLLLREGLLVAFFLAGLVVLGGMQTWWLQPLLGGMPAGALYWLTTGLTAITDNAAITYLASLVQGVSDEFKYAVVAGAVTGGGLTIIANAPNPAGVAILKGSFDDESISPLGLFLAALPPTAVAALAFLAL